MPRTCVECANVVELENTLPYVFAARRTLGRLSADHAIDVTVIITELS
jgi:hypothetical protein